MDYEEQLLTRMDNFIRELHEIHESYLRMVAESQEVIDAYNNTGVELSRPEARVHKEDNDE